MYEAIIAGIVGGFGYSLSRFSNKKLENENLEFKSKIFFEAIVVGALLGGLGGYLGLPVDSLYGSAAVGFAQVIVRDAYRISINLFKKLVARWKL